MRYIYITRGLPGSGKTTWAKEQVKKDSRFKRINRDSLREMFDDTVYSKDKESFIRKMQNELIRLSLNEGFDVILDNTHLIARTVQHVHELAKSIGDVTVIEKCFNVSVDECLKRNETRVGNARVPDKVILDMARSCAIDRGRVLHDSEVFYSKDAKFTQDSGKNEPIIQNKSLQATIICDLDGTLSLLNGRNPFDAATCDKDLPNHAVIECVKAMYLQGSHVIFMSGREDKYREPTIRFINQHCRVENPRLTQGVMEMPETQPIWYDLRMRKSGDQRPDAVIKRELFDEYVAGKYFVEFVLDDRNSVVAQWRAMGLNCFQVNYGNF